MNQVFDSSALIAYFRDEVGAEEVENILREPGNRNLVHASNLCEVYYDLHFLSEQTAEAALVTVASLGVVVRDDLDCDFWKTAGKHKASLHRISLADCYCLTLAQREDAVIITSDHDFDKAAEQGLCRVRFIR